MVASCEQNIVAIVERVRRCLSLSSLCRYAGLLGFLRSAMKEPFLQPVITQ